MVQYTIRALEKLSAVLNVSHPLYLHVLESRTTEKRVDKDSIRNLSERLQNVLKNPK